MEGAKYGFEPQYGMPMLMYYPPAEYQHLNNSLGYYSTAAVPKPLLLLSEKPKNGPNYNPIAKANREKFIQNKIKLKDSLKLLKNKHILQIQTPSPSSVESNYNNRI